MKLKQQSRITQHLALTPQLQQSIRLLQLSGIDLKLELKNILQNNPLLEGLDTIHLPTDNPIIPSSQAITEFSGISYSGLATDVNEVSLPIEAPSLSMREHLTSEIHLLLANRRQQTLAELIIDALDENGYLLESLQDMLDWLPPELDISLQELESALVHVQSLEPAGIAARNSSECLAIQLKRLPQLPYITRKRAIAIVENHLALFAKHDFTKLKKVMACDDEDLADVQKAIQSCTPHPGSLFSEKKPDTVIPELLIFNRDGQWQTELNPAAVPQLRINTVYADILKNTTNQATLATQFQEANWLIRNLKQRFDTILRIGRAITERQQHFFSDGAVSMKPLVLREIADTLELHESTVSRVTSQKYMYTPHGILELKYFFSSHVTTETGREISSTAIREHIRQLIGEEDKKKPLSDNTIAQILRKQGLVIARRTVTKYRETLKILPSHMRKFL